MVTKYILAVARYVNEIYGNVFSGDFISKLSKYESCSWVKIKGMEGMGDFFWLMDLNMDSIINSSLKEIVLGKKPDAMDLVSIAVNCEKRKLRIKKGDKKRFTQKDIFSVGSQDSEVYVALDVDIDDSYFEVSCCVENKICCCVQEEGWLPIRRYRKRDSLEIIIIKKDYVLHRMFTIAKDEKGYFAICSSNNWDKSIKLDDTDVKYELVVEDNRFVCRYLIPWSFLEVDTERDKLIPFNVCASISNPEGIFMERTCNLFKKGENFWDFIEVYGVEIS